MAAVQSLYWNLGTVTVATEKIVTTDRGIPPKHYLLVMDELWKVLRASEQMVSRPETGTSVIEELRSHDAPANR
ncbi:hypothetical protein [Nesterenkonia sandarakina]|uniref:Uncharacterized protein n=1 Tax=Nesterenkonia sandarakina TaxID=272918 RepID=A0A2T0YAL8_9MICC|nr:hypothetical protein [Nesterenkonia sandarakina]PRZ11741.1 hypothetical protein BCL67_13310 [Nesterenkonia sandarakina]